KAFEMPTECERSSTSPATNTTTAINNSAELKDNLNEDLAAATASAAAQQQYSAMMEGSDNMSTSQTSTTSNGSSSCNGGRKTSITSPDPTAYVAKARVTRPTPPPPPYNPMQFVQIKPCNLYQTAQEQLKKAEEVKKIKEIRKEEPEDWQNNLDNWKSSRRKRVEHIIDRVVEVKKLELEEHDRTRRKSKTFSEMIEERGERSGGRGLNKLASLAVYAEDEANDLSDLGIGTSSASGKSSLSEDYDNNSVMSDNAAELDKAITNSTHHNNNNNKPATTESTTREYISSPGYETSSSTAPASSPDPCEYTYEGAIQDYKQRVSRAASGLTTVNLNKLTSQQQQQQHTNSKESTPERPLNKETAAYPPRRGSKIEDRLMGFEVQSPSEECVEKNKVDVPKIDISKRKEIFESIDQTPEPKSIHAGSNGGSAVPRVTLRDRFKVQETNSETLTEQPKKELKRLSGDITSIKERLQSLEQQQNLVNGANGATKTTANKLVDIPVPPLKERLSSLQNAVTKEEVRKPPVVLVDARQLEIMKSEEEKAQQTLKQETKKEEKETKTIATKMQEVEEIDRDDSGIHTADDVELELERHQADKMKKEQELKLNAAIEALAKEEQQLSDAANAVNQIEAEFEELTLGSLPPMASTTTAAAASANTITNDHMEYSVSSTNPTTSSTFTSSSHNLNEYIIDNPISSSSSCSSSGIGKGLNSNDNDDNMVKGLDFKTASNLRRKPTNEMVHAKNLLRIFKDTFQNDIELDDQELQEENETKNIREEEKTPENKVSKDLSLNIKTQVFENSKMQKEEAAKASVTPSSLNSQTPPSPLATATAVSSTSPITPLTPTLIPRCRTPLGKPPMSPQAIRASNKFPSATPPASPSLARKHDSQFSINGRVEIFNSKTMTSLPNATQIVKPTTPTMTTKKTQLPYINRPIGTMQSNDIVLPQQNNTQQQQLPQEATTKQQQQTVTTTVIEPITTTTAKGTTQQQHVVDIQEEKPKQLMKSMPSQQMVNEPQTKLAGETYQHHSDELVKQQQLQQQQQQHQQPEVVVCAPPITIVNPDELPKPNTVKNLSSCFQQADSNAKTTTFVSKQIIPKPLPRSRIPQATPPASPIMPRRHTCYNSDNAKEELEEDVETVKLSPTSVITPSEEKKLSMISNSSTSSTSTGSTVIDNTKKLSVVSNVSSISGDVAPTLVQTNAQVHKEVEKEKVDAVMENCKVLGKEKVVDINKSEISEVVEEQLHKPAKTLDKQATQALVDEMIKADAHNRTLILDTKDLKPKPLKLNLEKTQDLKPTPSTPLTESEPTKDIVLQDTPKTPKSPLPYTSPLAALHSPKSELFKTTTPLVVSTLYDKYQPTTFVPNNQRTPLAPLKPIKPEEPTTPTIVIPAELPPLLDCPPNDSTLYKLASSAPHSPTSPRSPNSEKNMAIDSALCNSLLTSLAAATPAVMQRQFTVEEDLCEKVDKDTLPFKKGSTGFKDISPTDIKRCDGLTPTKTNKLQVSTPQRQITVEEELCQKLDVHTLPDGKQQPITGFKCISPTEIRKCDNYFETNAAKPSSPKTTSKPSSPIMQAREAHSKALIETCEKIIAEERLASTQMKSSLPSSPVGTPLMQRKSKIPKPISSCCKATESLNEADYKKSPASSPTEDNSGVIARMHVVETQIKVTTTTPPASPKVAVKPTASPQPAKKTKNIFDFLKKNFGVGGHANKEETQTTQKPETATEADTASAAAENKVLVLSEEELKDLEKVTYDEIHTYDNSKFYVAAANVDDDLEEVTPPPLPKTPAPVNIEITRKIITNEIVEDGKTEKDFTKEIDDLLDDELNKLNQEIEELEKAGKFHKIKLSLQKCPLERVFLRNLSLERINEALELALAAIDKETIPQLQQQQHQQQQQTTPQQQPENLYPITAPFNNTISTTTTTTTNNNNNNNNVLKETEILEVVHKPIEIKEKEEILINKTDEEKCKKLKLEEQFTTTLEIKEKSEEEISREPIYENINTTTSAGEVDVVITNKTSYQQQQQPQQQQIIPSMMSKTQIDIDLTATATTATNNDSKQNFNCQNLKQNQNSNQNNKQNLASASNQLKNSQINNSFNCPNNNNNNNSKINNNIQNNIENNNNNNCNVVELTNAFANTTITTTTTSAKTTPTTNQNLSDLNTTTTFNHLEQPIIDASEVDIKTSALTEIENLPKTLPTTTKETIINNSNSSSDLNMEPYYQVPKSSEPYYDAPKHLKPVPVYENIEIFFNGNNSSDLNPNDLSVNLQPPKEKPPPPPIDSPPLFDDVDSSSHTDAWSSDNTYETLSRHQLNHHNNHQHHLSADQPSPPIKRMNSTKRIKKELRNKRSSFLGIEGSSLDDDETYLELTVAPPPDMAQLLQEERRLEKQLYLKAGLCDSSDTGESRDSGVSENHSRQSSEHYTNSSEENETHDDTTSPLTLQTQTGLDVPPPADMIYQNDGLLAVVQTPLLTTVKGNSAESWTESATVAAAATQSLTEATATANAKMMSIEEKIREQEEVLRVERELLQLEQEELKRQRENLMLRENMARRELQHGAKMLMSANRRSLQDLNGLDGGMTVVNINGEVGNNMDMYHSQMNHNIHNTQHLLSQTQLAQPQQQQQAPPLTQQQSQQIYANIPNLQQQYYHMENDYRKSMSDINEFSKRMMSQPPAPPSKPMRAMHINTNTNNGIMINGDHQDYAGRQRHSLNSQHFGGSLVKIAPTQPTAAPRAAPHIYSNYHHQSVQNLSSSNTATQAAPVVNSNNSVNQSLYPGNMSRNTLHALSATPKPKYTDGWVQVQQRKSYDSNLANDPAWLSAYQQKRKSMPDSYHGYNQNNHWLIQEAEQRRLSEQQQQQRRTVTSTNTTTVHQSNNKLINGSAIMTSSTNGKPLPDSIIQTLTERVQSKGIGERKRNNLDKSPLHAASTYQQYQQQQYNNKLNQQQQQQTTVSNAVIHRHNNIITSTTSASTTSSSSTTNLQGQTNLNNTTNQQQQQQDKVLSVSGKKKCSHCGDELGRGAAMIIESLLLFYHINCFKCCVCHVQLGDGLNGTDVRVRNHKLHCQNCYSSDDGIKFSCV
ncbi:Uncharacterized protein FF38_13120, partial [Lucilia cuprina]